MLQTLISIEVAVLFGAFVQWQRVHRWNYVKSWTKSILDGRFNSKLWNTIINSDKMLLKCKMISIVSMHLWFLCSSLSRLCLPYFIVCSYAVSVIAVAIVDYWKWSHAVFNSYYKFFIWQVCLFHRLLSLALATAHQWPMQKIGHRHICAMSIALMASVALIAFENEMMDVK